MGTIIIRDPEYCADYIRPHPNGVYGVYRLSYLGTGAPLVKSQAESNATPEAVAAALNRLQQALPLGILGDYQVLCTGMQIIACDDDPAAGRASGIHQPGWIGLSRQVQGDLLDILAHELAHPLEDHLSECQREQLWQIIGQAPGDEDGLWCRRPHERLAEYLSAALWGTPIDSRMPALSQETLARIREWALPILGRGGQARITIGEEPRIILEIGSTTALVDGRPIQMDVAPFIQDGRTFLPVRFITETLGRRVDWEPHDGYPERVLIY